MPSPGKPSSYSMRPTFSFRNGMSMMSKEMLLFPYSFENSSISMAYYSSVTALYCILKGR